MDDNKFHYFVVFFFIFYSYLTSIYSRRPVF